MVRNHQDGPDWIHTTIVEVLGPVTYLVETDRGQKWKRHADQIKDWLSPAPDPSAEETDDNSSPGAEPNTESPVEGTNPPETEHSSMPHRYPT